MGRLGEYLMLSLTTERLLLRSWQESDSADLYEYAKSEWVGPFAGWKPHQNEAESKEIIKRFIEADDTYAIVLKDENKVIGGIGLHHRFPDESLQHLNQREIGYVLNPNYWGRGIVPEAVTCLLDHGFHHLGLDLIWCAHYDFNAKSKRVIEKCGFNYQFTKQKTLHLLDDQEVNTLYYHLSKQDYLNRK